MPGTERGLEVQPTNELPSFVFAGNTQRYSEMGREGKMISNLPSSATKASSEHFTVAIDGQVHTPFGNAFIYCPDE